jgi:hypothetical protein
MLTFQLVPLYILKGPRFRGLSFPLLIKSHNNLGIQHSEKNLIIYLKFHTISLGISIILLPTLCSICLVSPSSNDPNLVRQCHKLMVFQQVRDHHCSPYKPQNIVVWIVDSVKLITRKLKSSKCSFPFYFKNRAQQLNIFSYVLDFII